MEAFCLFEAWNRKRGEMSLRERMKVFRQGAVVAISLLLLLLLFLPSTLPLNRYQKGLLLLRYRYNQVVGGREKREPQQRENYILWIVIKVYIKIYRVSVKLKSKSCCRLRRRFHVCILGNSSQGNVISFQVIAAATASSIERYLLQRN